MTGGSILTHSKIVICEGMEDAALVSQMQIEGLLSANVNVHAIGSQKTGYGINGLRRHLQSLAALPGFSAVNKIVIVGDEDIQPSLTDYVAAEVGQANLHADLNGTISIPLLPCVTATTAQVATCVVPVPIGGASGCLETLLWQVLQANHAPEAACVDQMLNCSGNAAPPKSWSNTKIVKAKVRAAIAILHRQRPTIQLSQLWIENPQLIPVQHPVLAALAAAIDAV